MKIRKRCSPKASKAARAFEKLVAIGQRLCQLSEKVREFRTKDLERFSRDMQSLCDKWDSDDLSKENKKQCRKNRRVDFN